MNGLPEEQSCRNADFPVGAVRRLEHRRYRIGEIASQLWETVLACLATPPPWRRYRVTPRANPAALRHDLLRGIQRKLHRNADFPVGDFAGWKTGVTSFSSMSDYSTL